MTGTKVMKKIILLLSLFVFATNMLAEEIVYRITEYNTSTEEFTIAYSGKKPQNSVATFWNEYGATTGNRYNQIPRGKSATLLLEGWKGCKINSITFSMCSNNKAGAVGFTVADGENTIYTHRTVDFNSADWFGQWVSKDLGVYVDITKDINSAELQTNNLTITLKAGTSEGSVYLSAITVNYTAPESAPLDNPLGWVFEKLEKKSTLSEGDVVMMYRNGNASADYDGMEKSFYLDVVGIASTINVVESDVEMFTLSKADDASYWILTDQYGRKLGATGMQHLVWDGGETRWKITLTYDGAEITNYNANYGTFRFNAPDGGYARFWNYKSTSSLQLPYLYRRVRQLDPILHTSLTIDPSDITKTLDSGSFSIRPVAYPKNVSDTRIDWQSSNSSVATVINGFVNLYSVGETTITAQSHDGGASATVHLTVTEALPVAQISTTQSKTRKVVTDNRIIIQKQDKIYTLDAKHIYGR